MLWSLVYSCLLIFLVFESARSSDGRLASPSCTYSCGGAVRLGRRTFRRSSLAHDTSLHPFTHHRHGPPSIMHPPVFSVHSSILFASSPRFSAHSDSESTHPSKNTSMPCLEQPIHRNIETYIHPCCCRVFFPLLLFCSILGVVCCSL